MIFARLLALFLMLPAVAQAQLAANLMEKRVALESEVQKNLSNIISTQLTPGSFTVGVNIQLKESKPPEPPKPQAGQEKPLGLDLGSIDVQEILASYERELEELKIKKENSKGEDLKFNVESMYINVGLDESYPEDYRKEFADWLQKRARKDYGSIAKTEVSVIKKTTSPEKTNTPETLFDKLRQLQSLIGLALIGLALLLGALWLGISIRRLARTENEISVQQVGEWNMNGGALGSGQSEEQGSADEVTSLQKIEQLPSPLDLEKQIAKIAFVCLELQEKVGELVRVWIDSGDEGILKTALLIDSLVTARERILSSAGALPALNIPLDPDLVTAQEENLAQAFQTVSQMELDERLPRLEKIYWDLISVRTLGLQSLRRPFDFLNGMRADEVRNVLSTQKTEAHSLALMYLEPAQKTEIVSNMPEDEKEKIIAGVLSQSQISQREIWDMDTAVKLASMTNNEMHKEKIVNLFPRTLEVLQVMNSLDEIKILRKVTPSLPDGGQALKTQYSTLAFADQWRPEYIRKLCSVATADELTNLIRVLPDARDLVLAECPPKMKTIIEDDLKMSTQFDDSLVNNRLDSLKAKWQRTMVSEKISLSRVIEISSPKGELRVA